MKPLSVDTGEGAPIARPAVEEARSSSSSYDDSPHHLLTQTDRFGIQSPHATKQQGSPAPRSPRGSGPDMPRSPRGAAPSNSGDFAAAPAVPSTSLLERLLCCACAASEAPHTGPTTTPLCSTTNGAAVKGLLGSIAAADQDKMCLVLDLDETLVHSSFRPIPNPDFVLPVEIDGTVHHVYVLKRPGVDEFLIECAKLFEIVVYTASLSKYADPLLDLLDTSHVIAHRLFREHCVFHKGTFVKDLSLIGRPLHRSIIIDNSPASYMFHPQNAVGCTSFIDRRDDDEFDVIFPFLEKLSKVENVEEHTRPWVDVLAGLEAEAARLHHE